MTMLSIVRDVCSRLGLPMPSSVAGSADSQSLQVLGCLNEEGQELAARHPWQSIVNEGSFTTVAANDQGALSTIVGAGYSYIVNETLWNRDLRRPVYGARSPQEWQQLNAQTLQGPFHQFRIRNDHIYFVPVPAAGQSIYFEWVTKYWALAASDSAGQESFQNDADTTLLSERLLTLGAKWRFLKAKGLDYAEDFNIYEAAVADASARDAVPARLNLSGEPPDYYPAVLVPSGSWAIS